MKTTISIAAEHREVVAHQLATLLADEFVLSTKTLRAHWNLEGPDFHSMHRYFEELYQQATDRADQVAERIRQLGHYAPASLKTFLQLTHLTEQDDAGNDSLSLIRVLLQDHESIIEFIRGTLGEMQSAHKDAGTSDFVTALLEQHEKTAWMLRAHLQ
ncbi:Dps family protein [Hymenobacter wooponensis]|uniref:DNA starvation/stationary phase protection protein n=1 Tax=Hymenobacter wooponensis TaxID=1525360 RepID=A0A4Z0MDI6_9BACT|nr:DNA starvation/stationary phase protection protein [Hymenobacter wooponensis]TGD77554.1 DNA starvation/stationary phase protection protein [Hymenobacter wooponensis]